MLMEFDMEHGSRDADPEALRAHGANVVVPGLSNIAVGESGTAQTSQPKHALHVDITDDVLSVASEPGSTNPVTIPAQERNSSASAR
jgi:hypothetical protein